MPSRARVLETSWGLEPYQNSAKKIPPSLSVSQTGVWRDNKIRSEGLAEDGRRSLKHLPETECGRRTQSCANLEDLSRRVQHVLLRRLSVYKTMRRQCKARTIDDEVR